LIEQIVWTFLILATEPDIITGVYNERQKVDVYFSGSSQAVKNGVYNRFTHEREDALKMLNSQ
jgi:hypothetical protein